MLFQKKRGVSERTKPIKILRKALESAGGKATKPERRFFRRVSKKRFMRRFLKGAFA